MRAFSRASVRASARVKGVAAEADVGRSTFDANALVPALETVGLDDEREAETATVVAVGSSSGVRFDGTDKDGSEFNSQLRNLT